MNENEDEQIIRNYLEDQFRLSAVGIAEVEGISISHLFPSWIYY